MIWLLALVILVVAVSGLYSMREVKASVDINAPADVVWRILSDFPHYAEWNPFIISVNGALTRQSPLAVTIKPALGGSMDFNLLLQSSTPPLNMVWLGQTLLPRLLDGNHYFDIEPIDSHSCRFQQGEKYSGLFLFFAWPVLKWSVSRSFKDMNQALKVKAESER